MNTKHKTTVYVAAYPKSGSTWLTRLLGDVLSSPTGGCMPKEDAKEIATEGKDRLGNYIVRKGHFVLIDNDSGPVVPSPHRLAHKMLTNERMIMLVRDPRDVCVSGAFHWRTLVDIFLERMISGDVARCGRWDEYYNAYLNNNTCIKQCIVRYEDLLNNCVLVVNNTVRVLHMLPIPTLDYIQKCVKRNEFKIYANGKNQIELRRNNMRKGIAGDYKNHFTAKMNDRIWSEFGWMMKEFGYKQ